MSSFAIWKEPLATASLLMWYAMLWFFLLSCDSGVNAFLYNASLLQNMSVDPSIGTPNVLVFYLKAAINSTAFFMAVNSDPKVNVSM